jgi:hypothetical protein
MTKTTSSVRSNIAHSSRTDWLAGATGLAAVLLVVSLVGPGWVHAPADPATGAPATTLDFQGLNTLTSLVPSTAWQQAYFGWLGWAMVVLTVATGVAAALRRDGRSGTALVLASSLGLLASLFAVKGTMSWSVFIAATDTMRIGSYMLIVGYVVSMAVGVIVLVRRRAA